MFSITQEQAEELELWRQQVEAQAPTDEERAKAVSCAVGLPFEVIG
jgi:hypothetical protein